MSNDFEGNRSLCRSLLEGQPPLLKSFSAALQALDQFENLSIAVKGSIHKRRIDQFSDIDLAVWYVAGFDWRIASEAAEMALRNLGVTLAHFPATHLGMPNLLVYFGKIQNAVVKVDIEFWQIGQATPHKEAVTILSDPRDQLLNSIASSASKPVLNPAMIADLDQKLCGWIWYTYTKIARGEIHEAISSLSIMRERGLLVMLQVIYNLPLEGCRCIESRLDGETLRTFTLTYPPSVAREAALKSLLTLSDQYISVRRKLSSQFPQFQLESKPETIIQAILDTEEPVRRQTPLQT